MKREIIYRGFGISPQDGKVFSGKTGNEIGINKSRIVYTTAKGKRSAIKKMRLVYEAVYGPLKNGTVLKAIDGDETNAAIENIRVIERKDYFRDRDRPINVVITEEQMESIKEDYCSGKYSYTSLAKKYGCSRSTIYNVLRGEYFYDKRKKETRSDGAAHGSEFGNRMWQKANHS